MTTTLLSLIMDLAVMAALGGMIYYTLKLSRSLNAFRSSREELKALVHDLTQNIDQAQKAIETLKKTSAYAADDLDGVLRESRKMANEMRLINETSEGLASRLEKLAERNRKIAEGLNPMPSFEADPDMPASYRPASAANVESPAFSIQDREFEEDDDMNWAADDQFSSQAERDLYEALQKNKKSGGR